MTATDSDQDNATIAHHGSEPAEPADATWGAEADAALEADVHGSHHGRRRTIVWGVVLGLAIPLLAAAVLGVEVLVAMRGPDAPPAPELRDSLPAGEVARALWLGDSTAAGVGVTDRADVLAFQVADRLGGDPNQIINLAVSGDRVADVVEHQLPRITTSAARVYISVGANDAVHLTTAGAFGRTYEVLIRGIRAVLGDDVEIVALGVPDMGSPTRLPQPLRAIAGWRGRRLDHRIRDLAANDPGVRYVPIAARTGPAFRDDPDRYFAVDNYHPSPAGYALWADAVAAVVRDDG